MTEQSRPSVPADEDTEAHQIRHGGRSDAEQATDDTEGHRVSHAAKEADGDDTSGHMHPAKG